MQVFSLRTDANRFQNIECIEEDALDLTYKFDGRPMLDSWRPPRFSFIRDREHASRPYSDLPSWVTHVPIFSRRAVDALQELLSGSGEILPIECPDGEYFAFNVTHVIDALDTERSEIQWFPSSPERIMDITRHHFRLEALHSAVIFKLPQVVLMDVFVTDPFVSRVREAGLTGFLFKKLWASDSAEDIHTGPM